MKVRALVVGAVLLACCAALRAEPQPFVYVSDQRVITLEWTDPETVILNLINLSDEVLIVRPDFLVIVASNKVAHYGQVIVEKPTGPGRSTYKASAILKGGGFEGYTIKGSFAVEGTVEKVALRLGSRVFTLEPLEPERFELMAKQIGEIELDLDNRERAIMKAGISRRFGSVQFRGDPDAPETMTLFPDRDVIPPVVLRKVVPEYTAQARQASVQGTISIEGVVTKAGDFINGKVVRGLGYGLDERALETVRNAWVFLPALKDGEIAEATVTLKIEFK